MAKPKREWAPLWCPPMVPARITCAACGCEVLTGREPAVLWGIVAGAPAAGSRARTDSARQASRSRCALPPRQPSGACARDLRVSRGLPVRRDDLLPGDSGRAAHLRLLRTRPSRRHGCPAACLAHWSRPEHRGRGCSARDRPDHRLRVGDRRPSDSARTMRRTCRAAPCAAGAARPGSAADWTHGGIPNGT
jgi:hypothetical protein